MKASVTQLNEARREKALDRLYSFDDQIMTLRDFLAAHEIIRKSCHVQVYSYHKRDGCYPKLEKPITHYSLWYMEDGRERGIGVPKLVWDTVEMTEKADVQ